MSKILVVDDEPSIRIVLSAHIRKLGHFVQCANSGKQALEQIKTFQPDLIITDLRMPNMDGMELFGRCRENYPDIPVVILTAHGTVNLAVEAMKSGAYDFLSKPFDKEDIRTVILKALAESACRKDLIHESESGRFQIIGKTKAMHKVYNLIEKVAKSKATALIVGESGTGKELVAKALHDNSDRKTKPFIQINCGAIPENLFESELFGHEKGSFTGAHQTKPGKFEIADSGTLFLDEVGELPKEMQVKLLRTLQDGSYHRVGSVRERNADVRLIAATNRDLQQEINKGTFREDLYYRLNVIPIALPPLRNRKEDIPLLLEHFAKKAKHKFGRENPVTFTENSIQILLSHNWPGNIRELENIIERSILLSEDTEEEISITNIPGAPTTSNTGNTQDVGLKEYIREHTIKLETVKIKTTLEECEGNVTHAAKKLGISRKSLQNKMREYGLRDI